MPKRKYLVSVVLLIIYILFCCYITTNNLEFTNISTSDIILKSNKPKEIPIAKLEITNLNISNYIYDFNSSYNNVDKNVSLLKESILPDQKNSIVFLAAHSGNSKVSYFNDLNKIRKNELIHFYYQDYQYIYQVINIYEEEKNGYIGVNKKEQKQLILTTCSTKDKEKQLVVESILIKKEKYHE